MATATQPTFALDGKVEMPALGLGTWQLTGPDAERGVEHALALGHRLIDTSGDYDGLPYV
jgi:diketogulonate reductase-like aldo/keto reductase